jgi:hypothetical protein
MIVSQADALQAEASTKLKGILAAAAAVASAPVQASADVSSSTSAANVHPNKAPTASEATSNKRPRDTTDERGLKKQTPANLGDPRPESQTEASVIHSSIAQSAHITGNQAARLSNAPSSVLDVNTTSKGLQSVDASKVNETSVSSLEGDREEAEDIQAKLQAELAWYLILSLSLFSKLLYNTHFLISLTPTSP